MKYMKTLLASLLLFLVSCASSPIVAYSVLDGKGAVYTDGGALVAFGSISGEAGMFAKGSSIPLTLPVVVDQGEVYLLHVALGINETRSLTEPLPLWLHGLIPRGHLKALEAALGQSLIFELEGGPTATPPPATESKVEL